jgi:hypothetical protein
MIKYKYDIIQFQEATTRTISSRLPTIELHNPGWIQIMWAFSHTNITKTKRHAAMKLTLLEEIQIFWWSRSVPHNLQPLFNGVSEGSFIEILHVRTKFAFSGWVAISLSCQHLYSYCYRWKYVRAFWDIAPCSLVEVDRRFRGTFCLHQQGPWWWRQYLTHLYFYETTRRYIPEGCLSFSFTWSYKGLSGPVATWYTRFPCRFQK